LILFPGEFEEAKDPPIHLISEARSDIAKPRSDRAVIQAQRGFPRQRDACGVGGILIEGVNEHRND
jgi:hypothetical protein